MNFINGLGIYEQTFIMLHPFCFTSIQSSVTKLRLEGQVVCDICVMMIGVIFSNGYTEKVTKMVVEW